MHPGLAATGPRAWASMAERANWLERGSKGRQMSANAMNRIDRLGAPQRLRGGAEAGLSIVVPVYNEAAGLPSLHERIAGVARRLKETRGLAIEVVYVDDGSRDATLSVAEALPAGGLD